MGDRKNNFDKHHEDIRKELGVVFRLDDTIEYTSTGEHSIEKYLARLEARKKAAPSPFPEIGATLRPCLIGLHITVAVACQVAARDQNHELTPIQYGQTADLDLAH